MTLDLDNLPPEAVMFSTMVDQMPDEALELLIDLLVAKRQERDPDWTYGQ